MKNILIGVLIGAVIVILFIQISQLQRTVALHTAQIASLEQDRQQRLRTWESIKKIGAGMVGFARKLLRF
jgi:hypothetical protein